MSYNGFLIKTGDYIIPPDQYIRAESYSACAAMQTLDSYKDANGYEHTEALELKALQVEFETPALLTNRQFEELMANIRANYTEEKTRRCILTAYIPEYDCYVTQSAQLADVTPVIYRAEGDTVWYNAIRFTWTGGVYDG